MTASPRTAWIHAIDPSLVERRFGAESVSVALSIPRVYVGPPAVDAAGRLTAVIVPAPGGTRLKTPMKLAVRIGADEVIDLACACRQGRICEHVTWLLVDVAFHPALRAAVAAGEPTDALVDELPSVRARALEERTLDERLAAWLPPRAFDDAFEMDVDVLTIASAALGEGRAAVLLRHRRPAGRALVPARDVLGARLRPKHRRLVDLTTPYHLDRHVLVSTRGQASLLVHLLRDEIGPFASGFKARVRFSRDEVRPRVEAEGDRLIPRWCTREGNSVGDAGESFLFAGPFPYLWTPASSTFHPVAEDVDLDAASGMHRVPSLPRGGAVQGRVGRALLMRGRGLGVTMPRPEVFGLPPLEKPSFELRLTGSPLEVFAEVFAVYAALKVSVGEDREADGRDLEAEDNAMALLGTAGISSEVDESGGAGRFVARDEGAVTLWQRGLQELRSSESPRFEVLVAESIARTNIAQPVRIDVRVIGTAGWLETELEFRAGAIRVEIERMHQAIAMSKRWVVLSDGSLAKIAGEVATLFREVAPLYEGADAKQLPPHQFGRVARWIELADAAPSAIRIAVDERFTSLHTRLSELARRPVVALPTRLDATLRPYQRVGLAWLQLLRDVGAGGLLADDMGLGKTLMTLAFLARWQEEAAAEHRPTLIVCPTSVVGNWVREAARFTPGLRVIPWTGSNRKGVALEASDVVVTTYGLLRRDAIRLARTRFRCVVLDEAQNVKNASAETTRAARTLNAEMRIALTGTPVENRLSELWSLMTFVNPGMLGTAKDFDERYERPIALRPDGEVAAELRAVVRPFILRRTKGEVLVDLPPKTELERPCVFGAKQRRLYDALALALRKAVGKDIKRRAGARMHLSVLTAILRLRQMSCDPRLVDPEASANDSAKRTAFLDLVRELVSEDRRALVFSQFVELLTLWREDLDRAKVAYEYLDGSTQNRDAVVERFQCGTAPLFLISLKAGGAGLNLTAADTVIHCDPWWNVAAEDQATDRAHRIGQTRPVTVIRLVAQGTIEDKIGLLKQKKQELAQAILGDGQVEAADLSDEDVQTLLGDVDGDVADDEFPSDEAAQAI